MTLRDSEVLADTVIGRPLTASAVPGRWENDRSAAARRSWRGCPRAG